MTSSKCVDRHLAIEAVAVAISMARAGDCGADLPGAERARRVLAGFRGRLYRCLTRRGDELFELGDAMLCADGPVQDLARLSLVAGHRRGHGAVYDALNAGRVDIGRLRWAIGCLPLPNRQDIHHRDQPRPNPPTVVLMISVISQRSQTDQDNHGRPRDHAVGPGR